MSAPRIVASRCTGWGGPLPRPARNARTIFPAREGLLLTLTDTCGHAGHGDAAPLPGYSPDQLADSRAQLAGVLPALLGRALPLPEPGGATGLLPALAGASALLPFSQPAARFALECALLDLVGQHAGQPAAVLLARSLGCDAPATVPQSALLDAEDTDELLAAAAAAHARGVRCFKLKIGRPGHLEHELALASALRHRFGAAVKLRLDANGALRAAGLPALAPRLAALAPEFLEQPLAPAELVAPAGAAALAALRDSGVAVALDESLQGEHCLEELTGALASGAVRVFVLKPMVLGGLSRTIELARAAHARGIRAVVSHLLDGPVAMACHAALATALAALHDAGAPFPRSPDAGATPPVATATASGPPDHPAARPPAPGALAAGLGPHPGLATFAPVELAVLRQGQVHPGQLPGLGIRLPVGLAAPPEPR
jgi:o-succinylbenzoate synthase